MNEKKLKALEIHFITGKGGVGKSIVAASLAYYKAEKELKRTLLVRLGENEQFINHHSDENSKNSEAPPIAYEPRPFSDSLLLDIALWNGSDCLKDYALYFLKMEGIYRFFFDNPISQTLLQVAPGLSELAILGKITSGPPRNIGPELPYECIVVDAYATGHFLALLNAPEGMSKAISFGPMGEQTRSIQKVLLDPEQTKYWVVTLPEELPFLEAEELSHTLFSRWSIAPRLVLNKMISIPEEFTNFNKNPNTEDSSDHQQLFIKQMNKIASQQKEMRKRMNRLLSQLSKTSDQYIELPFIFELDQRKIYTGLSELFSIKLFSTKKHKKNRSPLYE